MAAHGCMYWYEGCIKHEVVAWLTRDIRLPLHMTENGVPVLVSGCTIHFAWSCHLHAHTPPSLTLTATGGMGYSTAGSFKKIRHPRVTFSMNSLTWRGPTLASWLNQHERTCWINSAPGEYGMEEDRDLFAFINFLGHMNTHQIVHVDSPGVWYARTVDERHNHPNAVVARLSSRIPPIFTVFWRHNIKRDHFQDK